VSHDNTGKSSLQVHEEHMGVAPFERWLFGQQGGTPIPVPTLPKKVAHDTHALSPEVASLFKTGEAATTDAELQAILKERSGHATDQKIDVPAGFAPVTFVEADTILIAPIGANLRRLFLDNNIPLYSDMAKVLNCHGLGLCTTCRVAVDPNDGVTPPTAMEKVHLIRDNPKYRLSCQCEVTGPVTVSTKPAREYGRAFENLVRNSALLGVFSIIMLAILLVMGFDVVGSWF
jgi:ferredoxin